MNAPIDRPSHEPCAVLAGADEAFALGLAALGRSVIRHRPAGRALEFYAVDAGLSPDTRARLARSWHGDDVTIHWVPLDREAITKAGIEVSRSPATVISLMIERLLPSHVRRVLYLDADMLVLKDLGPLWNTEMGGMPLAAVQDSMIHFIQSDSFAPASINPAARSPYFNAGMLLIDLEMWRREALFERARELRRQWAHRMWGIDQQPLNWALEQRWTRLPLAWNRMTHILDIPSHRCTPFDALEFEEALRQPRIVHFAGGAKPWRARCRDDHAADFIHELQDTAWAGWAPPRATPAAALVDSAWREPHRRYQFVRRGLRIASKEGLPRWPWYLSAARVELTRPWSLGTFAVTRVLTRLAGPRRRPASD
jgi:lipopolysaccharide biosynthesis glycosyltransferase